MYRWLSSIAAAFGAPHARSLAARAIKATAIMSPVATPQNLQRELMGITFPGPVGLAAGFDKHGELYPALASLGFGFAETGSVIPLPEPQRSRGVDAVVRILSQYPRPHAIPLGVSVSMNRKTPPNAMPQDYVFCIEKLWKHADYFVINLGVRAGPDLHLAENAVVLDQVLAAVSRLQSDLSQRSGLQRPLLVKVDRHRGNTAALLGAIQAWGFDGLILSGDVAHGEQAEALAGLEQAIKIIDGAMPVVSVGGIRTPQDAADRLSAGAALVQVYSGVVESGPLLPRRINRQLSERIART